MSAFLLEKVNRECPRTFWQFQAAQHVVARMWFLLGQQGRDSSYPSCHHVARLVRANVPGLTVIDGHIKKGYQHSWLTGKDEGYIIDPYPILILNGPLLVDVGGLLSPWRDLYDASEKPLAIADPEFERIAAEFITWYEQAGNSLSMP